MKKLQSEISTKEQILKNVRKALVYKTRSQYANLDLDSNVFAPLEDTLPVSFAKNLIAAGGQFVHCQNRFDFIDKLISLLEQRQWDQVACFEQPLKDQLADAGLNLLYQQEFEGQAFRFDAAITACEALVARQGSILVSSRQTNGRSLTLIPPFHIVVAYERQLVAETKDAFQLLKTKYGNQTPSMSAFITGPSFTADIESKPVSGVHGPLELILFLIQEG